MDYSCEAKPSKIDDHLYLGGIECTSLATLNAHRISAVLTVDIQPIKSLPSNIKYLFIKAHDFHNEDLLSHFEDCHAFIAEAVSAGKNVLVHCLAGVSRSATLVVAYFMIKNRLSAEHAINYVRKKRTHVSPNIGFLYQLNLFEKMGRKVNVLNGEYRQFLMKHLKYKMHFIRAWNGQYNSKEICEPLTNYFQKLRHSLPTNVTLNQKHEDIYKCKKCRLFLFSEVNVIRNSSDDELTTECQSIYIEPLHFMLPYINNQENGQIICSNCYSKLGNFNWNNFNCDCKLHADLNCLMFKIDCKKVDSPHKL